jgi:vacuolar-type H+-ATPase subunit H
MPEANTKTPIDHLQDALEELGRAREKAGGDVSASIDSARERIADASDELADRGQGTLKDWREQFGSAADDALRELGRWAIRAQRSPDALAELSREISKREVDVSR